MSTAKNFIDPASLCSLCRMRLAVGLCAGCRCKRYCSKTCQKLDWIAGKHRLRCEFLKSGGCALDEAAEKETEEEPFEFSEEEDSESEGSDVGMPKRGREKGEKKKQKKKEPSSRRRKTEKESDEPGSLGKNEQKVIDTLLKSAKNPIPVSVSGAVAGEIVYGINENQTDGIEFEVIQGMIHRSKKLCDALGGDAGVAKLVSDRWHISLEASKARLAGIPAQIVDNAQPIGTAPKPGEKVDEPTAQLMLRGEGILSKAIDEVVNKAGGDREEILSTFNKLRTDQQSFTAEEFLSALRGGTTRKSLVLHQSWYAVRPPKSSLSTTKSGAVVDLRGAGLGGAVPGAGFAAPADSEIFEIEVADASDAVAVLVPKERPQERVSVGQMLDLTKAVCADVAAPGEIDFVYDAFARRASDGQRRAAVQKAVRLGAKVVSFACLGYGDHVVRTDVFACTTLATLFASAGSWNSDLKMQVRGCTSAFKRLAVMLFEDAWARGAPAAAFLAAALLAQNVSAWHPHKELVEQALRTCRDACNSTLVFRRHPGGTWPREDYEMRAPGREEATAKRGVKACKFKAVVPFQHPSNFELQTCAFLLAAVGSFAGDEMMVELFADQSTRKPPKLRTLDERPAQPLVMPIEHIVDQHAYVGVGHLIPGDASFTEKFNALFDPYAGVTGVNSRRLSPEYAEMLRQSGGDFEAIPAVARHRPAQRATLIFAHGLAPEADLSAQPKEFGMTDPPVEKFPVVLSAGTLAAAVGPILKVRPKFEGKEKKKIKSRELIVMLGTQKPEDEAVMLAPSRDIKRTEEGSYLYESVTPEEKEEAIRIARSKTFKLTAKNCPEYPHWKGLEVAYDSARECWTIGGIPYEKARLDATKAGNTIHAVDMTIDTSSAKAEPDKLAAALVRARKLKYPVVTVNAISGLDKLCVDTTTGALFRALALLKQQFQKVEFPKPARDGMQASDELMVFPQDAEAYMFMLCVSALYPGALRASDVPTFEIRDVQLLRWIENRIAELTITRRSTTEREEAIVTPEEMWQFRNPVSRSDESKSADLDEMQKQSVEDLSGRFLADGYRGHFVFVPTGGGKTRITMQFLRSLAESEPKKFPAKYVVWLTPKETIESLSIFQELRLSGSPPIVFCEPETRPMAKKFKKAKNPVLSLEKKKREKQLKKQQMVSSARLAKNSQIVPWCVNVVKDDTLRDIAERLLPVAHEIALVIDEADRFYNMTKRTSWTYELARLSPLFVCQTGTPMRSTKDEGLRMWLQQTVGFPVTPRNWLVAASTMIAKTLDLGIEVSDITETVDVDVPALRTKGYETLVKQRDWAHAADVVYEITDQTLVGIAIREAARDRREFDEYTRNAVIKFEELTARKDRNEKLTDAENDELLTSEMIARERNTKGGILLEARNREHAADLARAINAILDAVPQGFRAGGIKNGEDDDYGIIVLPKDYARGFNFATRFGALVRGVNPGNAATRRQMLGRILRMGQRRIRVKVITVYMKDTIVEELYKKQNTADGYNKAFDAMADKFDSKLLLERFEK